MKIKQYMLGKTDNLSSRIFFWNMAGSIVNALSTLLLSVVVAQVTGEDTAGVFLFAFAIAQQMLSVGWYEMRPYQSTDVKHVFGFSTYLASRIITCAAMLLLSIPFIAMSGGTLYSGIIAFLLCIYKMFDAAEDIFHGMFQQNGRLDIAGKALFFRVLISTAAFLITLCITQDLIITSLAAIAVAFISFIMLNIGAAKDFESIHPDFTFAPLKKLMITCFPLFAGSFMLLYIYNAPKYAIQNQLLPKYQTYYNALFMPTFVINLFSGFVLKPLLTALANSWVKKELNKFRGIVAKLSLCIMGFTAVVLLCAYVIGIPILSWLYGVDLSDYRMVLMTLLLGGGFSAFSIVLYYALTVMRRQSRLILVYFTIFIMSLIFAPIFVRSNGIEGAAMVYLLLMVIMTILFILLLAFYFKQAEKETVNKGES